MRIILAALCSGALMGGATYLGGAILRRFNRPSPSEVDPAVALFDSADRALQLAEKASEEGRHGLAEERMRLYYVLIAAAEARSHPNKGKSE